MNNKTLKRKNEIKETAVKLFLEKGGHATTIRDISSALGISTGALYHYYKSKQEIIDYIAVGSGNIMRELRNYYKSLNQNSYLEALRKCIIWYIIYNHQFRFGILFNNREWRMVSPAAASRGMENPQQEIGFFESLLDEGCRNRELKIQHTNLVAFWIWATVQEWALRRWYFRDRLTLEEYAEGMADIIIRAIKQDNS